MLQTILDEGYIGLLILVVLIWRTFVLLRRHLRLDPRSPASALVAMLLVIILSGATEVSPTYYSEEVLLMVFLIAGAAAALALKPGMSGEPASTGVVAVTVNPQHPRGTLWQRALDRFLPYSHVYNPWRRTHRSQPELLRAMLLPVIRLGLAVRISQHRLRARQRPPRPAVAGSGLLDDQYGVQRRARAGSRSAVTRCSPTTVKS